MPFLGTKHRFKPDKSQIALTEFSGDRSHSTVNKGAPVADVSHRFGLDTELASEILPGETIQTLTSYTENHETHANIRENTLLDHFFR